MQTKNEPLDDLEYLSQLGFEEVPVSDVEIRALSKKVRKTFFPGTPSFYLVLLSGCTGVFIGAIAFYMFYSPTLEKTYAVVNAPDKEDVANASEKDAHVIPLNAVEVLNDNFVKPAQAQTQPAVKVQERPLQEMDTLQVVNLPPSNISAASGNPLTEQKIKFIINSPVVYIHDLKVSDYGTLYFKKNQFVKFGNRANVTAEYAYKNESDATPHLKQQADYFLHQELADALLYFKQKKYDACMVSLTHVASYNTADVNCDFYLGMCCYYKKKYSKALLLFNQCIENPNNAFLQEATYYKALALLEQGNTSEAAQVFSKIVEEGEFYSEKAKAALANL